MRLFQGFDVSLVEEFWEGTLEDFHDRIRVNVFYKNMELILFKNYFLPNDPREVGYDLTIMENCNIDQYHDNMRVQCKTTKINVPEANLLCISKKYNDFFLLEMAKKIIEENNFSDNWGGSQNIRLFQMIRQRKIADLLLPYVVVDLIKPIFFELGIWPDYLDYRFAKDNIFVVRA